MKAIVELSRPESCRATSWPTSSSPGAASRLAGFKCPRTVDFRGLAAPQRRRQGLQAPPARGVLGGTRARRSDGHGGPPRRARRVDRGDRGRACRPRRPPARRRTQGGLVRRPRARPEVAHPRPLFLRYDRSDPARTKDPWTVQREAGFYRALQATDVPVAPFLGVHPSLQAMLSERVTGGSWFSRIADPAEQEATARHFMECLAALHRADPTGFDIPGVERPAAVRDGVRARAGRARRRAVGPRRRRRPGAALHPRLAAPHDPGLRRTGRRGPGRHRPRQLHVRATGAWSPSSTGSWPTSAIRWTTSRGSPCASTQEPFTDLPARLREYEGLSGNAIDEDRVRYYQVMAEAKIQVMAHRPERADRGGDGDEHDGAPAAGGLGADLGNGLIYGYLHRRLWLEALADRGRHRADPGRGAAGRRTRRDHTWLYGALLDQLEGGRPPHRGPAGPGPQQGLRPGHQAPRPATDAHGAFYEACELDDLDQAPRGAARHVSPRAGERRSPLTAAGGRELDYLSYLWRRTIRDNELARPAMGALADRHWPALR